MDLEFLSAVDEKDALLRETAHFIFDHAETAFTEFDQRHLCTGTAGQNPPCQYWYCGGNRRPNAADPLGPGG